MEKSFLNFKAAHPEWQPTDPSGSLYLSRMADFSTAVGLGRRRLLRRSGEYGPVMESTIFHPERKVDSTETLRQSQLSRRARGNVLAQSRLGAAAPESPTSIFQSNVGLGMAQTAVLGDSNGSVAPPVPQSPTPRATNVQTSTIPEEDLGEDGGVVSALGGSYVDGLPKGPSVSQSQQEEDEALEDGGVLGLLAQIYGTSAGLTTKGGRGMGRGAP